MYPHPSNGQSMLKTTPCRWQKRCLLDGVRLGLRPQPERSLIIRQNCGRIPRGPKGPLAPRAPNRKALFLPIYVLRDPPSCRPSGCTASGKHPFGITSKFKRLRPTRRPSKWLKRVFHHITTIIRDGFLFVRTPYNHQIRGSPNRISQFQFCLIGIWFWLFGLIFSPLEVRDGSQIVDLVEIYRSNFLFFIFEPWTSCLRPKYVLEFSGYLLLPPLNKIHVVVVPAF